MLQKLKKFKTKYPEIQTIIGMDANQCLYDDSDNPYYTIPSSKVKTTATKKRTTLQVQFHKAEVDTIDVKDHLMSTMPIKLGSDISEDWLPKKSSVIMVDG